MSVETDLYPRMSILRVARATPAGQRHALADSSDFGLLGKQNSQTFVILCLADELPCKI